MGHTDYSDLTRLLLSAVPELAPLYDQDKEFSGEEFGAHVVFGDILTERLLIPRLRSSTESDPVLSRAFSFLEQLAQDANPKVRDVVRVTVCERLGDDKQLLRAARSYMGRVTLALSQEIERMWGRE